MSLLISVTEIKNRQGLNNPPIPKLYGTSFIDQVFDNGTSATIILNGKHVNEERVVSESYSTIDTMVRDGYIDAVIPLTQTDGRLISLKASGIIEVYENKDSKSVVWFRDNERNEDTPYIVNESLASIEALLPTNTEPTYKSYVAVVTQSGTDDPVDVVQIDEIGMGAWTRFFAGNYGITPTGTVDASKLAILSSSSYITSAGQAIVMETSVFAGFGFLITSQLDTSAVGTATDGLLSGGGSVTVEIRLYN